MMMKDRYPNKPRSTNGLLPWVALGILAALIVLRGSDISPFVRSIAINVMTPSSTSAALNYLSRDALIARIEADEKKLRSTAYQRALYELALNENASLRAEQNASVSGAGIVARVMASPPRTHYGTLILDRGSAEGLQVGDLVVSESVALGKIISVSNTSSLAELFSSPGKHEDVLLGDPVAVAVSVGLGGGSFEVSVPQGVLVAPGDAVRIHASLVLLVGIVQSVTSAPTDISKKVQFHSPLSISAIDFVRVIPATPPL